MFLWRRFWLLVLALVVGVLSCCGEGGAGGGAPVLVTAIAVVVDCERQVWDFDSAPLPELAVWVDGVPIGEAFERCEASWDTNIHTTIGATLFFRVEDLDFNVGYNQAVGACSVAFTEEEINQGGATRKCGLASLGVALRWGEER